MTGSKLDGTIAVVAVPGGALLARRLVGEGATVVVTGNVGEEIGHLLAELEGGPGRLAHFHRTHLHTFAIEASSYVGILTLALALFWIFASRRQSLPQSLRAATAGLVFATITVGWRGSNRFG